ncbi:MAG: Maf family nucleotide pyrophosphatase [Cytophagaceae bacterium]|nr:Maf family nucleotide pyrophosphatase [Cytophagaceae bacterium]
MSLTLAYPLLLGSNSPRRQQILRDAGFQFEVRTKPTEEDFPPELPAIEVPGYLARKKAEAFSPESETALILTADTVVRVDEVILNKPANPAEARQMLQQLSGRMHLVTTGVCLLHRGRFEVFADTARVFFRPLSEWEISYYLDACRPFDKAGAYGVQDFIGMVGIERIEGSYFTVMGLPVHRVYEALRSYLIL